MFSGIVEEIGTVVKVANKGSNFHVWIHCSFLSECYIDQSIAHNGVCLTIDELNPDNYRVTIVKESLERSNLGELRTGSKVNLERSMRLDGRLDGHLVQGHVDIKAICESVEELDGSWYFQFSLPGGFENFIVQKGSITVDGVSLTVAGLGKTSFKVAIIPYTFQNTCFQYLQQGNTVNLEFDVISKYVAKHMEAYKK